MGAVAASRGRSGFGWFLFSCLLSPLLGGLAVLLLSDLRSERLAERRHAELLRVLATRSGEQAIDDAGATEVIDPELEGCRAGNPRIGFGAIATFVVCGSVLLLALFNH